MLILSGFLAILVTIVTLILITSYLPKNIRNATVIFAIIITTCIMPYAYGKFQDLRTQSQIQYKFILYSHKIIKHCVVETKQGQRFITQREFNELTANELCCPICGGTPEYSPFDNNGKEIIPGEHKLLLRTKCLLPDRSRIYVGADFSVIIYKDEDVDWPKSLPVNSTVNNQAVTSH